ncbi:MAG TPA: cation transporter, partial [Kofleriaceae bacterium]
LVSVPKMDCASEEQMIRGALDGVPGIRGVECNLGERTVRVVHEGTADDITAKLVPLGLGASLVETTDATETEIPAELDPVRERKTLRILLAVNATMFAVGLIAGVVSGSTGLLSDSLDMFADATVFALSLYAVSRSKATQLRAAHVSGWLQAILALAALGEVVWRFIEGGVPGAPMMMVIATVSLVANSFCLRLMARHRGGGAHMKASTIFLANDVLANLGVIGAGVIVHFTSSQYPDLVVGTILALVVLNGARRILRLQ